MSNRSRDPIGEAFGQSAPPTPVPTPVRPLPLPTKSPAGEALKSLVSFVLLAGLLVALGWMLAGRFGGGSDDRRQDDQHQQHDDQKKKDQDRQKLAAKPGFLIIVRERISALADDESSQRIAKYCADQRAAGVNLEYRDVDEDDDSEAVRKLISHAQSKSIPSPFVVFKSTDNLLGGVIKLPPATATDAQISEVFSK